jgi:hypothetical protein
MKNLTDGLFGDIQTLNEILQNMLVMLDHIERSLGAIEKALYQLDGSISAIADYLEKGGYR